MEKHIWQLLQKSICYWISDRHQLVWKLRKKTALLILSETELIGWSESRNFELFYYLGHHYLPTYYCLWFHIQNRGWFWPLSLMWAYSTSHPEPRHGRWYLCPALLFHNSTVQFEQKYFQCRNDYEFKSFIFFGQQPHSLCVQLWIFFFTWKFFSTL